MVTTKRADTRFKRLEWHTRTRACRDTAVECGNLNAKEVQLKLQLIMTRTAALHHQRGQVCVPDSERTTGIRAVAPRTSDVCHRRRRRHGAGKLARSTSPARTARLLSSLTREAQTCDYDGGLRSQQSRTRVCSMPARFARLAGLGATYTHSVRTLAAVQTRHCRALVARVA